MDKQHKVQMSLLMLLTLLLGVCAGMTLPRSPGGADAGGRVPVYASWLETDERLILAGAEPEETENLFALVTPTPTAGSSASPAPHAGETAALQTSAQPTPAPGFAIEVLGMETAAPRKRVLIYHTHTYEAYEQDSNAPYKETEKWRTMDNAANVVRVGEELAGLLRGLGMEVVHDVTAFEPPELSSAYTRSLEMLKRRVDAGERYDLYIDLHRDAYAASQTGPNTVSVGGTDLAKLMLLVGKGEGQTAQGFAEKPDWESNLKIAQGITDLLNAQCKGLCRDVRLKSGRFNQHIAVGCVLVEAGNNRNTLQEVLAAMPYLADAIVQSMGE